MVRGSPGRRYFRRSDATRGGASTAVVSFAQLPGDRIVRLVRAPGAQLEAGRQVSAERRVLLSHVVEDRANAVRHRLPCPLDTVVGSSFEAHSVCGCQLVADLVELGPETCRPSDVV